MKLARFVCALSVMSASAWALVPSDTVELKRVEEEQVRRLNALHAREASLGKVVRQKTRAFHALTQNTGAAGFVWEDDNAAPERQRKLERMLQLSIREDIKEIEALDTQEADLETELAWIRTRLKEMIDGVVPSEPEAPAAAAPTTVAAEAAPSFHCQEVPVAPAPGKGLSILQDFGTRRDPDTGIEWRSLGWWIGQAGPEVRACAGGTVAFVGTISGRGRVIILEHAKGAVTLYANLNEDPGYAPRKGEFVAPGRVLGTSRDRVYFEARRQGFAVNPRDVIPAPLLAKSGL